MDGEEDAKPDREREHLLARQYPPDDALDQVSRTLDHMPAPQEGQTPLRLHENATSLSCALRREVAGLRGELKR